MGVVTQSINSDTEDINIESWLLLDSDLGGTVQDPIYFFEENSTDKRSLLDALMLTHGWRRFVWKTILDENKRKKSVYAPEKGIMITGRTTDFGQDKVAKQSLVTLNILRSDIVQDKKTTDDVGRFSFGPYYYTDTLDVVIQAVDTSAKRKTRQNDLSILLDPLNTKIDMKKTPKDNLSLPTLKRPEEYLRQSYQKMVTDFKYDPKVTQLNEVVVVEKKKTRDQIITEIMNAEKSVGLFSHRVYTDSVPGGRDMGVLDLLQRVPGVRLYNDSSGRTLRLRNSKPEIYINGIHSGIQAVQNLQAEQVMFIDVVKHPDSQNYGFYGYNGVIAVYLKRGFRFEDGPNKESPGIASFKIPGFDKTREFYVPDYADSKKEIQKPDYRTTLFWKPDIKTDKYGRSSVGFYTGDGPGTYQVKVEGITNDGRPVSGIYHIEVSDSN